jgi:hypothetical protein
MSSYAVAGGLNVAKVHNACQRRRPEARNGAAARVERKMITGPLVKPTRRHHPGVFFLEIALLRLGEGTLVPRMALIHGISQWIFLHKRLRILPIVVVGAAEQNANVQVDVDQVGGHKLPVHHDTRSDEHGATPVGHPLIGVVANLGIVE